ncbi:hypothetical protein, partial [Falsirhodobacter sp. 1013]|uniref:hypothetical protein n=1 Tax=Falsirhodobacter sp. 1013 TaxID=3417566 RepID=UPI003EBD6204
KPTSPQSRWPQPSCFGCDQERVLTLAFDSVKLATEVADQGLMLRPCIYLDKIKASRAREFLWNAVQDKSEPDGLTFCRSVVKKFLPLAATFKHGGFSEEREWRILSPILDLDDPRIMTRTGRSGPIHFLTYSFPKSGSTSLASLTAGPGEDEDQAKRDVARISGSSGWGHLYINASEIPYRTPPSV